MEVKQHEGRSLRAAGKRNTSKILLGGARRFSLRYCPQGLMPALKSPNAV